MALLHSIRRPFSMSSVLALLKDEVLGLLRISHGKNDGSRLRLRPSSIRPHSIMSSVLASPVSGMQPSISSMPGGASTEDMSGGR